VNFKNIIPWYMKIIIKLFLSRVPLSYKFWRRLKLFQHGQMEQVSYAYNTFMKHFQKIDFPRDNTCFVALELGPGDSLYSALIAKSLGASSTYLVDVGRFAIEDIRFYKEMASFLINKGYNSLTFKEITSFEDILIASGAKYLTSGLSSLYSIPNKTVDFIWSHACLEHVRKKDFLPIMNELRRIIKDHGICSHRVDLRDHLGGGLNNLRFSGHLWESDFMANSGFYTNRIRSSEMLSLFETAGFSAEVVQVDRWNKPTISRKKISKEFRQLSDEELCIYGFDVILKPS